MKDLKLSAWITLAATPFVVAGAALSAPLFKGLYFVSVLKPALFGSGFWEMLLRLLGGKLWEMFDEEIFWIAVIAVQCLFYLLLIWITVKTLRAAGIIAKQAPPGKRRSRNDVKRSALWALLSIPLLGIGGLYLNELVKGGRVFVASVLPGPLIAQQILGDSKDTSTVMYVAVAVLAQYLVYAIFIFGLIKVWNSIDDKGQKHSATEPADHDPAAPQPGRAE